MIKILLQIFSEAALLWGDMLYTVLILHTEVMHSAAFDTVYFFAFVC